jgi:hypothetical protein
MSRSGVGTRECQNSNQPGGESPGGRDSGSPALDGVAQLTHQVFDALVEVLHEQPLYSLGPKILVA